MIIDEYFIGGYWCLLMAIILVAIGHYYWLLMVIILMVISAYTINGH